MGWLYLFLAGLMEVGWPVGFKYAQAPDGFRRTPALLAVISMIASFWLMVLAQRSIPIGTVYVVWTGIGSIGAVLAGIVLFREPATAARMFCITLILAGIVGLKWFETESTS
jgi:quaternary ammonium compound-resistance protein SugE